MCRLIYTAQKGEDERAVRHSFDIEPASETSPNQTFQKKKNNNKLYYFQEIYFALSKTICMIMRPLLDLDVLFITSPFISFNVEMY